MGSAVSCAAWMGRPGTGAEPVPALHDERQQSSSSVQEATALLLSRSASLRRPSSSSVHSNSSSARSDKRNSSYSAAAAPEASPTVTLPVYVLHGRTTKVEHKYHILEEIGWGQVR